MPEFTLQIERDALKFVKTLLPKHQRQISTRLAQLRHTPFPHDSKLLKNTDSLYRLDQGEYRILYTVTGSTIRIARIGKRNDDEVYRGL
jgi:mRNA interferase RelE/StbE